MSYILGFIIADGCLVIKRTRKDGTKQFLLNITSKDMDILKRIKKEMKATQKIGKKYNSYFQQSYQIQIGQQNICRDLMRLGVFPKKTFNLNPIDVPNIFFPDFIRGFFDGDGTVYIYNVNSVLQIKASFSCPSFPFLNDLNKRLCNSLTMPLKNIHRSKGKTKNIYLYSIYFYIKDCKKLFSFMYNRNSDLYLKRKYEIFEKWKQLKILSH